MQVIQYSKDMKDKKGLNWPILGMCQGLQLFAYDAAHNMPFYPNVLSPVTILWENRKVNWTMPAEKTNMWKSFPASVT